MLDPDRWKKWQIPGCTTLTVSGYSRAGEATGFYIKQLRWCLDAGVPTSEIKPERVFITHGHTDHAMMLPLLVPRDRSMDVYAPAEAVPFIRDYVASMDRMNQENADAESRMGGYNYVPVSPGQSHPVGRLHTVEIIRCQHTVTSVGYLFSERRRRLKEEFKGKSGQELGRLRKEGIEFQEEVSVPLFAFLGDTTDRAFSENGEKLSRYPVVFVECTYLLPEHAEAAASGLHNHWDDLKRRVADAPGTTFVLIHFSKRYDDREITDFFEAERRANPGRYENVVLWL